MAARAYLAPVDRTPHTVSDKTVAGAYLPCTFVTEGASTLTQATAVAPMLRLLINRDYYAASADFFTATNPLLVAYASGDSGVAAIVEPGQRYLVAVAAATYAFGDPLTVGAAGRLTAAGATTVVVAYALEAGAKSAGDLIAVEIANFYRLSLT
jgi:hypothetical protein